MSIFEAIILGAVQGVTEFIPVSSSGHLILARELMGLSGGGSGLAFDAVLQLATSLAILLYFRRDISNIVEAFFNLFHKKPEFSDSENKNPDEKTPDRTLLFALILGTIPAGIAGILLEEYMETVFRSSGFVAWVLIAGSAVFLLAERLGKKSGELTVGRGFIAGLFQTLALLPGMSRAGITISGGLFAGLTREAATRFAFLLGFPVLFGSGVKKLLEIGGAGEISFALIAGSAISFFVGLGAIHFLISYLKKHTLFAFIIYRLALAAIIFAVF